MVAKRKSLDSGVEANPSTNTARTNDKAAEGPAISDPPQASALEAAECPAISVIESLTDILDQMAEAADQQEERLNKWVRETKVAVDANILRFV